MPQTTIPIEPDPADEVKKRRAAVLSLPVPLRGEIRRDETGALIDTRGRPLHDLRISVTDHCNFRCRYCMPKEKFDGHHKFLTHTELLTFEEIYRLSRLFVGLGVRKLRLTGGEPLLRKHLAELVAQLKTLTTCEGKPVEIAMTTNATLLSKQAAELKAAGLDRVTVSLDAMTESVFQGINDVGFPVASVLAGIEAAQNAGLPVKVNTVVQRGVNEGEIVPLCTYFRGRNVPLRFIEYMDAGTVNGWRMDDVVRGSEIVSAINAVYPIRPADPNYRGETAERWVYEDGAGEIGVICSVSQPFCRDCSRVRLSVEGGLFLCLFADRGYDIRTMLRGGGTDEEIADAVSRIWCSRGDHYSEIRTAGGNPQRERVEMQFIGG